MNLYILSRFLAVFLTVATVVVQDAAEGWSFPKQQARITVPFDFPLHLPFYRVASIPDSGEDSKAEFEILKLRTHVTIEDESRPVRAKPLVDIDKKNGSIWLIRKPTDLKLLVDVSQGKVRHHVLVNITVAVQGKSKDFRRIEILLTFSGSMNSYCEPSAVRCFENLSPKYFLSEGIPEAVTFDYLLSPSYHVLCPNNSISYSLDSEQPGYNLIQVNIDTGELIVLPQLDAEFRNHFSFRVNCFLDNETYSMDGHVVVLDVNDNIPVMQDGNTTKAVTRFLKPGENWVRFSVSVIDNDSKEVNDLAVRIEDDSLNVFKVTNIKIYETDFADTRKTFFYADIVPKVRLYFPGDQYKFKVNIEDRSYMHGHNKVSYVFSIINQTEPESELQDIYEVNVSRSAGQYYRILQLSKYRYTRRYLFSSAKSSDWLGITEHTGIIYISNPLAVPSGVERRNVIWSSKNEALNQSGQISIIITITENSSSFCESGTWCSFHSKERSCKSACGASQNGHCVWRQGPLTHSGLSVEFSTCSPDLLFCPDQQCDELEEMFPSLCPQDCATEITGEASMLSNGRGISAAVGPCTCQAHSRCKCVRSYPPPGEMRRARMYHPSTTSSPNDTYLKELVIEIGSESSTLADYVQPLSGPFVDTACGPACILLASVIPFGLLMFILILVLVKKLKSKGVNKHKFVGGSHISLSAVPSDYVEERSNSFQDSRNSETASFGKTVIDSKWEFPRNRLQFVCLLGEGEFGKVMKAEAWNIAGIKGYTTVAVKMLKENGGTAERQDLLTEFLLLKELSHPNVVKLLGASTEKNGDFFLIVEYAEMGSLRSYLRKQRRHNNCCRYNGAYVTRQGPLDDFREYYQFPCERSRYEPRHSYFHKEQLSFAWQIAKGMAYLSDLKLVHRDLATRNILLAKQKVVKISDFGLSRDVYEGETYLKRSKGKVPVKWMAIESLEDQIYTSRSDVWSFGVVLWEIMMNGATPYPGVTPQRLYNLLKAGYRMTKPDYCPDEVYLLMRQCWRTLPRERPSFKEIVLKLDFLLQDTVEYMDFVPKLKAKLPVEIPMTDMEVAVKYTAVLIDEDEEVSGEESNENISLVGLFEQPIRDNSL